MSKKYSHRLSKSRYIETMYGLPSYSSPLKRSLSGYEIELMLVDKRGDVNNSSELIIDECKKEDKNFPIMKEVGKNMVEIHSLPFSKIQKTALFLINNVEKTAETCEKHGLYLFPLATYPGKFKEQVWKKKRYVYSARAIHYKKYFYYYSHCCGFHYHYTLPRGVFNTQTKFLNQQFYSKIKKTLLDSYNFLIAADPVLTTLTQSSPFEGGKYYAKDSRAIFLRGGKRLKFDGLYNDLQLLGALPPYKQTLSDLVNTLNKRDKKFRKLLEKSGASDEFIKNKSKLDLSWNPVKINQVGTLEQRGMDTNHLDICLGTTLLIKFILRAIQQEFYHVIPADIGITEPFKLEGNVIFIPPHTHVRNKLQHKSAYYGLEDDSVYKACCRFYKLARKLLYRQYVPATRPIKNILDNKRTVSDDIIHYVKKKGYSNEIPQELCRKIVLNHSKRMLKCIAKIKKKYERLD